MREMLIQAVRAHASGHVQKHKANIEVFLSNAVGVGEHSDLIDTIEKELDEIAKYNDQIEMIDKYFKEAKV
jgi:undecaprenyl pyrophosphate synthase